MTAAVEKRSDRPSPQAATTREESIALDKKQRILSAAKAVFLKYGYGRVTMNDLARAAHISRPALYLVFGKKQDLFRAVILQMARETADDVSLGLQSLKSPLDRLRFVCETWMVRPFNWVSRSAEAKEIIDSAHEFAQDAVTESRSLFERDLAAAILQFPNGALPAGVTPRQAAHLLAGAIEGVRRTCQSSAELREKMHILIAMMIRT